jgi:hypothetical protein
MVFAAPDFGSGGTVVLLLLGISLAVGAVAVLSAARGILLLRRSPPRRKWPGLLLIGAGVLLPVLCCNGPGALFRLRYSTPPLGRYPSGVVQTGMSADEVRALLGDPHQIHDGDPQRVTWIYYRDSMELGWFMVTFSPDGKVAHTGGN